MRYLIAASILLACAGSGDGGDSNALLLTTISAGSGFTCGLQPDQTAVCWGANQFGQLGVDSTGETCSVDPVATGACSSRPVTVAGGYKFVALDASESHVCALTADGRAFCWGDNASGQLGDSTLTETCAVDYYEERGYGPTSCAHQPRAVMTDLRFAAITAASGFTCALTADGVAYCWGAWSNNRLGGTRNSIAGGPFARYNAPHVFTHISADGGKACTTTASGHVFCWGAGAPVPVRLESEQRFVSVSRGWRHTCGIAADSTAYCWGDNDSGQLGNGHSNPKLGSSDSVVYPVTGDFAFSAIDAGFVSTCASTFDGLQFCWGDGDVIGVAAKARCTHAQSSGACAVRPERTPLRNVIAMTSGFMHRCAVVEGGRVYCWGYNQGNAIAPGAQTQVSVPRLVSR